MSLFRLDSTKYKLFLLFTYFLYLPATKVLAEDYPIKTLARKLEIQISVVDNQKALATYENNILPELETISKLEKSEREIFRNHQIASTLGEQTVRYAHDLLRYSSQSPYPEVLKIKELVGLIYPSASPYVFSIKKILDYETNLISCQENVGDFDCLRGLLFSDSGDRLISDSRLSALLSAREADSRLLPVFRLLLALKIHGLAEKPKPGEPKIGTCLDELLLVPSQDEYSELSRDLLLLGREIESLNESCRTEVLQQVEKLAKGYCELGRLNHCIRIIRFLEDESLEERAFELKRKFILSDTGSTHRNLSRRLLTKDVFSTFTTTERFQVLLMGLLPGYIYFILGTGVLIIFTLFYLLLFHSGYLASIGERISKAVFSSKKDEPTHLIVSKEDEYSALLAVFGLDDKAKDADIKKSYRDMIKKLHPDSGDREAMVKFEAVQKAYERLLELRKGWFGLSRD